MARRRDRRKRRDKTPLPPREKSRSEATRSATLVRLLAGQSDARTFATKDHGHAPGSYQPINQTILGGPNHSEPVAAPALLEDGGTYIALDVNQPQIVLPDLPATALENLEPDEAAEVFVEDVSDPEEIEDETEQSANEESLPQVEPVSSEFDEEVLNLWVERVQAQDEEPVLLSSPELPSQPNPLDALEELAEWSKLTEEEEEGELGIEDEGLRTLAGLMAVSPMLRSILEADLDGASVRFDQRRADTITHLHSADERLKEARVKAAEGTGAQTADQILDKRVRELVGSLSQRSVDLPGRVRTIADAFRAERTLFNGANAVRKRAFRDADVRARSIHAELDLAEMDIRSKMGTHQRNAIETFERHLAEARKINALVQDQNALCDARQVTLVGHQGTYSEERRRATELLDQLQEVEALCETFSLPFPPEVQTQAEDAVKRLRGTRAIDVMRFSIESTPVTAGIRQLMDELPRFEDILVRAQGDDTSVFRLFMDRQAEIQRLMVIGYHLLVKERPRGRRSLHGIMQHAGLLEASEYDAAKACVSVTIPERGVFEHKSFGKGHTYKLTAVGTLLAKKYLRECKNPAAIRKRVADGQNAYFAADRARKAAERASRKSNAS